MSNPVFRFAAAVCIAAVAATGCATSSQSVAVDVDISNWDYTASLAIRNRDTVTLHDATLFMRCNERFAEDTLTLRITTMAPDRRRTEEYIRLNTGRTYAPAPLSAEPAIRYRSRIRFSATGRYRFSITPTRPVKGVEAVGLQLTNSI